ncbi:MAG: SLC13 family permease [Acidobacteria bacterium]|nr:SLC13 family permease [Acidobacteriota bacterium]MDA1236928.1 SLC13 family permease [Acidobacteriota bacterium]
MERDHPSKMTAQQQRTLHLLGAPAVFLLLVLLPLESAAYPIRGSLGLLVWMSWWWIFQPVHLAVTGLLPLVVLAIFNFLPVASILPAYAQQLVILLIGANILATVWTRWGLDRRIALVSLLSFGAGAKRQILAWFGIAVLLSTILPNVVVAAALMPIVLAMLRFVGIKDVTQSKLGSALLIAVAWGTSVGGVATPLGGAPNLLTVKLIEEQLLGHEFLFITWVTHLAPLTLLIFAASFLFMRFTFRPDAEGIGGTRDYFSQELNALGSMKAPEKWALGLFAAATLLSFARQLYAESIPGLTPALAFMTCAVLSFTIRHRGEPLVDWEYAEKHMIWGLIYLFAGGSALGQILSQTGTAQFLADQLVPLAEGGGFIAVAVFSFLSIALTQSTSNTAAAAIVVPITISTFQSLGLNPIPFVYIVAAAGNCGFMLPSSSGGPALAAGYGVNLKTMFVRGLWLTLLLWLVILFAGYLLATYWPTFGEA